MTPTHILVPIEWLQEKLDFYKTLDPLYIDPLDEAEIAILLEVDKQPKVDLSEEGIEELALNIIYDMFSTNIRMNGIRPELRDLCVRFAKDLLNIKL